MRLRSILGTATMVLFTTACGGEPGGGAPGAGASAGAFTMQVSASAIVRPKAGGAISLSFVRDQGFTTPVSVAIEGLPPGVQAKLPPPGSEQASTILLTASADADFGTHEIVVTAHANGIVRETPMTLVVAGDPGTLDPTFGAKGLVGGPPSVEATNILVDRAGRTVVVGTDLGTKRAFVARYTPEGLLDSSFATKGIATFDFATNGISVAARASEGADGSLYVVGISSGAANSGEGCVTKLDASGALDTSYGNGGTYCAAGDDLTWAVAIEVLPDGSSVIGGTADMAGDADMFVLKLLPDGKPATSFGVDGRARWARPGLQHATSLHIDAQNRIVVAGTCGDVTAACAIRLSPDGGADPWFGEGGVALLGSLSDVRSTADFAFAPDGTIFFVGGEGTKKGSVVALEPEKGALVPGFGAAGVASFSQASAFYGVSWDDGVLHVVGTAGADGAERSLSMRISPKGHIDTGYGEQGTFVHPGGFGTGRAIALAPGRATILTADDGNFRLARVWR